MTTVLNTSYKEAIEPKSFSLTTFFSLPTLQGTQRTLERFHLVISKYFLAATIEMRPHLFKIGFNGTPLAFK